jgi:multiple sugar transport system permease protein
MKMSRTTLRTFLLMLCAAFTALFFLSPYLVMLFTSLKPTSELFTSPIRLLPMRWVFANYTQVWRVAPIGKYLENTLIIAGTSTVIVMLVAVPAAYATARMNFRGRGLYMGLVLLTQMFAPVALLVGLYRELVLVGLVDTLTALIITNAAFNLAFAVWILNGYFSSIPYEIEEAAIVDGCGRFAVLGRIVLPLALPGLVTALIFTFIAAWNEYVLALTVISSPGKEPISIGVTSFIGKYNVDYQYLFAASLIAIVPVVILFALIEKRLVEGLTAGGIK